MTKTFRDLGRSEHYFQGAREQGPPPGGASLRLDLLRMKDRNEKMSSTLTCIATMIIKCIIR